MNTVIRYGSPIPLPEPKVIRTGELSFEWADGSLRNIRYQGIEVARSVYCAVRDPNWGTIQPRVDNVQIHEDPHQVEITFEAIHRKDPIHFGWKGHIRATAKGILQFQMDGEAKSGFLKNRIGFCVLHPANLAGSAVRVETRNGTKLSQFPRLIAPNNPFTDIISLRHPIGANLSVVFAFEGDDFEMEDQRNWTDASFKTFCTPLRLPFPVPMNQGDEVHQAVRLQIDGQGDNETSRLKAGANGKDQIVLNANEVIGLLPRLGIGMSTSTPMYTYEEAVALRELGCDDLQVFIKLSRHDWRDQLRLAGSKAKTLGTALVLELVCDELAEQLEACLVLIAADSIPVSRMLVFPHSGYQETGYVTTKSVIQKTRACMGKYGLRFPLGGGARSNFAEFNRADLPLEEMDFAAYPVNPQVHAFDLRSILETLEGQAATAESAKHIAGNTPLYVGPVTIKPRANPAATNPADADKAEEESNQFDPRQRSLFAGGWAIGSLLCLSRYELKGLTYFVDTGPLGIIEEGGKRVYPIYHVLREINQYKGAQVLSVQVDAPHRIAALAIRSADDVVLMIANFVNDDVNLELEGLPDGAAYLLRLNEETFSSHGWHAAVDQAWTQLEAIRHIRMLPFEIAFIRVH